jgi:hypothetical protein
LDWSVWRRIKDVSEESPKIMPVCDYYHHRQYLALIGPAVVRWR